MSIVALLVVAIFLVLPLALLILTIILLVNPRTRTAGAILAGVLGLGFVFLLVVGVLGMFVAKEEQIAESRAVTRDMVRKEVRTRSLRRRGEMAQSVADASLATNVEDSSAGDAASEDAVTEDESSVAPAEAETRSDEGIADDTAEASEKSPIETETGKRPAWVDAEPKKSADAYETTLVVGPFSTLRECEKALPLALQQAAQGYVEEELGYWGVWLPADQVEKAVTAKWEETRDYSVGEMKNLHVRLVFDDTFNQDAQEAWRQAQVQDRVGGFVGITAIVLGSLAGLFGLLKLTGRKKTKSQGGSDGR